MVYKLWNSFIILGCLLAQSHAKTLLLIGGSLSDDNAAIWNAVIELAVSIKG